nr:immunoglobulin light chain junction region [Macaca mulatta]MOY09350.1 immunoglobulin light chain junction region [Macaca mulatta]
DYYCSSYTTRSTFLF